MLENSAECIRITVAGMVYLISHEFRDPARRSRRPDINLEDAATYYGTTGERVRDAIRYQDIFGKVTKRCYGTTFLLTRSSYGEMAIVL